MSIFPIIPSIFFLIALLILFNPSLISNANLTAVHRCSQSKYSPESPRATNLQQLLSNLPTMASETGFYNSSFGERMGQVFGLAICLANTSSSDCLNCLKLAAQNLNDSCSYSASAVSWCSRCMLHYSDNNFISLIGIGYHYCSVWGSSEKADYQPHTDSLTDALNNNLMKNLSASAAYNSKNMFAVGEMSYSFSKSINGNSNVTIYGLAQCTRDLSATNCFACLTNYTDTLLSPDCSTNELTYTGGSIYGETCFFWYDRKPFNNSTGLFRPSVPDSIDGSSPPTDSGRTKSRKIVIILVSVIGVAAIFIVTICIWFSTKWEGLCNSKAPTSVSYTQPEASTNYSKAPTVFSYNQLQTATNNFSYLNFIDSGATGEVFKATINGKSAAVKRYFRQENVLPKLGKELNLLVNHRHKNILKLEGCCFGEKDEKHCIVYEYMANGSLHDYWKSSAKRRTLNWTRRLNIIKGCAEGLCYLHNLEKKTIHADVKLSNILLDEEMNAKVADFDLSRSLDIDETHQSTERVHGTMGYIPPEGNSSAHHMRISVKSDVYSFGVVILEIVTGERINKFENSKTVYFLNHVWEHWNSKMSEVLIDKELQVEVSSNNEVEEMLRCIHIGLLCTQENAQDRPNMVQVVSWLGSKEDLPEPGFPAYWTEDSSGINVPSSSSNSEQMQMQNYPTSSSVSQEVGALSLEAQCVEGTPGEPETNSKIPIRRTFSSKRTKSNSCSLQVLDNPQRSA